MKKYTWDEIYKRADECCFGEDNLKVKDNARENVRCLALEYGEEDLEKQSVQKMKWITIVINTIFCLMKMVT